MVSRREENQIIQDAQNDLAGINYEGGNDDNRRKADFKPEIFFIGQIVGGTDFPTDQDGIFVEACVVYGETWDLVGKKNTDMQTHTSFADDEGFFIFAHPFDFNFVVESVQGW